MYDAHDFSEVDWYPSELRIGDVSVKFRAVTGVTPKKWMPSCMSWSLNSCRVNFLQCFIRWVCYPLEHFTKGWLALEGGVAFSAGLFSIVQGKSGVDQGIRHEKKYPNEISILTGFKSPYRVIKSRCSPVKIRWILICPSEIPQVFPVKKTARPHHPPAAPARRWSRGRPGDASGATADLRERQVALGRSQERGHQWLGRRCPVFKEAS